MDQEFWEVIEECPTYEISTWGRIRRISTGRLRTLTADTRGNIQVQLYQYGKMKPYSVAQLVASHFIRNPEGHDRVGHWDFDRSNNHVENLFWGSHREIMRRHSANGAFH